MDKRIVIIFENCKKSMSVQKSIPLFIAGKISSPTVLGFFRPRVLLSRELTNRLSEHQLRHIFYHELAHIKRRDVGVNLLMYSLLVLNWFNPILWFAYFCMREDQELACDAYALTFLEEEEKISYGLTIINLLEHYSKYYQVPSLANMVRNKRSLKRRISMIKRFQKKSYRWSTIGVVAVIAVSSFSLLNANADGANGNQQEQTTENATKLEIKNVEDFYIPTKQKENFEDMTKEEILTKMLNTVDYFETANGEYKVHYGHSPGYSVVEYTISLGNKPGGIGKRTNTVNGNEEVTFEYYKDGSVWTLSEQSKTYMESEYLEDGSLGTTLKIGDAFFVDSEGINVTKYRERPPIGVANETLFPYEIASNYTRDLNSWEIEKQNEELLGQNTLVIKGNINRRDFQSFRFWVDKDTGILVKYETYSSAGDVVDYLYPTKLEINVPIDSKKFTPNLEGYKNYELSREEQPHMTTGNIDDLIPEELKEQWEEAKKKPDETTLLHLNDQWYIYVKKGYLVDRIEVNGKEGTLYLTQTSAQKSQYNFHTLAEGFKVDTLKIVLLVNFKNLPN
jgi:outer membrane lipoprotein-sorting protein